MIGVGIPWQLGDPAQILGVLQPPVWYDWLYRHIGQPGYLPMLWQCDHTAQGSAISNWQGAVEAAQSNPAQLWLLGNEPEFVGQSNTTPAQFAASVAEWQRLCGNPIALPGVYVNPWADWRAWMDAYMAAGGTVPDVWHIHIYVPSPQIWESSYMEFVRWMEQRRAVRPVIVSETSAAQYSEAHHLSLLDAMPTLRRLPHVRDVLWYSARHMDATTFAAGNLLHADNTLTALGEAWQRVDTAGAQHVLHMPVVQS